MARKESRILTSIWGEPEWRALSAGAQWLYLFLISQPDIAHDGVISLRERRWAKNADGVTPGEITGWLKELESSNFVVVDETTEEVLVRSFMRHDQVFLQPNLMAAAVNHLAVVESHRVRRAIYSEIARIVRENGDHARRAAGDRVLTEKQKIPIRQMIEILRRSGDAELAIEGPRIRPVDLPEPPVQATRPRPLPDDDLRSPAGRTDDPLLPAETEPVSTEVDGSGSLSEWPSPATRPGVGHPTQNWVNVDTDPYHPDDPLRPAEVNPSENPSGYPLVRVSSPYSLIETPNGASTNNGHRQDHGLQGDLLAALPGRDSEPEDPLLDDLSFTPTVIQERAGAATQFEIFWEIYPLKVKKAYARQCWDRAIRRAPPEKIIRGARRYAADPGRNPAYTAHPSSWLNQDRWDDAALPSNPGYRPRGVRGLDIAAERRAQRRERNAPGGEITNG